MVQISKLENLLTFQEYYIVLDILKEAGFKLDQDLKMMDDRILEAFVRLLVEREQSRDKRKKIVYALRQLLEESGNPIASKFNPRTPMSALPPQVRKTGFQEVRRGYTLDEGIREAQRCLTCKNPRCVEACPIHFGIPAAFRLIAQGKIDAAYKLSLSYYPCLGTTGRICVRFCENACIMNEIGMEPLAIRYSHRVIADYADKSSIQLAPKPSTGKRVAIVGSGPAGLNAAYHLALNGYSVTVYDAADKIGGMLRLSIPEFRLPSHIVEDEVSILKKLGVRFELGKKVGRDITISDLAREYDAVFIGVGANKPKKMGIPGENLQGVIQALPFLYKVKNGEVKKISGKVWVIGGGDVAMDAARTSLRLGASQVKIMYRRSREEMPADPEQVDDTEEEGVEIVFLATPIEFIGEDGVVKKMKCIRMKLGEPGPDGRRRPEPIPGSEFIEEVDYVILAIGQDPELDFIKPEDGIELTKWGTIKVDENMATTRPGVFAGGDAVRGPATAIEAFADGKKAAESIHKYLQSK
ncbi:MAG: NAD(P)-dependent oxidoreductase [Thaumarchaeota archaeon]|nr:NAD(P)-dependent oxidoreductase [Candidatus Geocrenenecus arthurdayi]MCL7391137.1 NAD(P)-dependent oxidoreductase [Candidatus Geocrenenecus arthurdayi]MCL7397063.1 NAD(P)-dependent oxidoreductase [Candidatus Geocrenenecus arthurdayi]MCL7403596.1 NAD(P)-dependent oxidoreductase [Candidatus Geocrenenecus arthurdayi]